ncbi:MAG: hypothetical protein ACLFNM_02765 [Candidatus Woesearchaeota archaeon]
MELEERIITHIQTFFGNNPHIDIHTHKLIEDDSGLLIPANHKIFSKIQSPKKTNKKLSKNQSEEEAKQSESKEEVIIGIQPVKETRESIQPYALSHALSSKNAQLLQKHIKENYPLCNAESIYKKNYCSVIVQGPINELKKCIKKFNQLFMAGMNQGSVNESIRQQIHFPHAVLETVQHMQNQYTTMSSRPLRLEEFQALKTYAFDDEFMCWWDNTAQITSLQSSREDIISFLQEHKQYLNKKQLSKESLLHKPRKKLYSLLEEFFISKVGNEKLGLHKRPLTHQLATKQINPKTQELEDIVYYFKHLTGKSSIKKVTLCTGPATVVTKKFSNAKDMLLGRQEFIHNHPALIFISQNGMGYDLLQEREFLQNQKKNAPRGQKKNAPELEFFGANARINASAGFFKKVTVNSLIHIDLAPYSQNYFPFTVNNKLETVISLIRGERFVKTQNYQQQIEGIIDTIISKRQLNEDEELYGSEDVSVLLGASDYAVPLVYLKEKLFSCSAEDVCCTSKKRLAVNEYLRKKIKHYKTSQLMTDHEEYDNFLSHKIFKKNIQALQEKQPHLFGKKRIVKKGSTQASMYYLTPFSKLYSSKLSKNPVIKEIYNYIKKMNISTNEHSTAQTLARFDLMHTIEEGYLLPKVFEQTNEQFKGYKQKKDELINQYAHLLARFLPINNSGYFYVFPQSVSDCEAFQEAMKTFGCKVTQGAYVGFGTGSFAINDGTNIYKREIDVTGKRGFKTLYEQELISKIIPASFSSSEEALFELSQFFKHIQEGTLEREKLIYFVNKVARDYEEFSSYAQRQERVQQYVKEGLKKGSSFAKAKLAKGWFDLETFLTMTTKELFSQENKNFFINTYIGPQGKRNKLLSQSKVGKIIAPSIYEYSKRTYQNNNYIVEKIISGKF